jgi:hypothetical protein
MPVLEAVTALKSLESRTNDLGIGIRSLSGKVSGISLSSVSANLAERFSTIDVVIVIVIVIELIVVKLSGHLIELN